MSKKIVAKSATPDTMEIFEAVKLLEKEKGITSGMLLERIKNAIAIAVRRDMGCEDNTITDIDMKTGKFNVYIRKSIVEQVEDNNTQITEAEAKKVESYDPENGYVDVPLNTKDFGRIAAQAAKHVIRQGIREVEREQMLEKFQNYRFELVTARVIRIDPMTSNATVEIDGNELLLPRTEQLPEETLRPGQLIKVYVVDVKDSEKGPRALISRTHQNMVRRLFEKEVFEIADGTVEIKAVAREAGSRTKISVYSRDPNIDPVGACIGHKGARVAQIIDELGGEKIDIVKYSPLPSSMIAAALAPASVIDVEILDEENKLSRAIVPDHQLSLAIGNRGQNARLAAKLTGWKIDIHSDKEGANEPGYMAFDFDNDFFASSGSDDSN
ncbi:MAG TPA: transcription termination factor NusA [Oscillospiraceae bacterium]|nr:transcription termination factor NusA [Oscillospiraceae bacterium]HPK35184.1 transcription termination factor NusA [Oscillospiraceae bacterium]HPR74987.1 transcription termination factor NusA [Oscillospiraceae bacterium]